MVEYRNVNIEAVSTKNGSIKIGGKWYPVGEKAREFLPVLQKGQARVGIEGEKIVYIKQDTEHQGLPTTYETNMTNQEYWYQKFLWDKQKSGEITKMACINSAIETVKILSEKDENFIQLNEDLIESILAIARRYERYVRGDVDAK